jgi:hypothetical protein
LGESGVAPTQVGWVISAPRASILLSACVGCKHIYFLKIWLVVAEKPKKWVVAGFFGLSSITGLVSRQFHSLLGPYTERIDLRFEPSVFCKSGCAKIASESMQKLRKMKIFSHGFTKRQK